ncbi:MAG: organomercurial lyase, partial [Lachnospiraceae bacterium]
MLKNIDHKFTARGNKLRLYIINFIIDEKRPFHLDKDQEKTLKDLHMEVSEYQNIVAKLLERDGMVTD